MDMPRFVMRWRMQAQLVLGRQSAAVATLDQMLSRWPQDMDARASRAHLRAQAGDAAGALADCAHLTANPRATAAHWFNQGFIQEAEGLLAPAEASFRQALALDEKLDRAWFGLGLVLTRLGRLDEAMAAFQRNTQLQPMSPHGWCELARIHERRREPEEVARIIRHLQGFEPSVAARLSRETGMGSKASAT
jgi:Flp pilus assembly protein TadD